MMQVKGGIQNRYRKMEQDTTVIEMAYAPALSL